MRKSSIRQYAASLRRCSKRAAAVAVTITAAGSAWGQVTASGESTSGVQSFADSTGTIATLDINGHVNPKGAFFQGLGSNGRSCATCHIASEAMSISVVGIQARFEGTQGKDPLFASIDGANCPNGRSGHAADHSLLLKHGLIRVFLPVPAGAEYIISVVHDPYGCAMAPDPNGGQGIVSVYRRPLPTTNLDQLSTVMFDGRETIQPLNAQVSFKYNLATDLTQQALDAITIHAQATAAPTAAQLADIVQFELGLFTAQTRDNEAGSLEILGASGGPQNLSMTAQEYYPGVNDSLGADPSGAAFNPASMTLFSAWVDVKNQRGRPFSDERDAARRAIAAGEVLFNSAPVHISNVRGINDNAALGNPTTLTGTCTTCHDTPNTGNHSFPLPLDIGTGHSPLPGDESDPNIVAGLTELSPADLPVYLIQRCPNPFNDGEPESFYTTDPGKALVTGHCSDFNRGKGPILRGLAARAPYFHNGSARDLTQLINFYNQRFQMSLTEKQKRELIAFLNSL